MFIFDENPSFTTAVTVNVPTDAGHEEQSFKARFAVLHDDQVAGYDLSDREQTIEFLRLVWTGFDDVLDADRQPLAWSAEQRDRLLGYPYVRLGLIGGYFRGMLKAQTGN